MKRLQYNKKAAIGKCRRKVYPSEAVSSRTLSYPKLSTKFVKFEATGLSARLPQDARTCTLLKEDIEKMYTTTTKFIVKNVVKFFWGEMTTWS